MATKSQLQRKLADRFDVPPTNVYVLLNGSIECGEDAVKTTLNENLVLKFPPETEVDDTRSWDTPHRSVALDDDGLAPRPISPLGVTTCASPDTLTFSFVVQFDALTSLSEAIEITEKYVGFAQQANGLCNNVGKFGVVEGAATTALNKAKIMAKNDAVALVGGSGASDAYMAYQFWMEAYTYSA